MYIVNTSSGNSKPYYYTLFVFSEINPDDHDMKARLDAFSYVQLSLVAIEYSMMRW
jgi:hypothetical protein